MINAAIKFYPSGDSAVTMEFGRSITEEINDRVLAAARYLREHPIGGVIETVPTYSSLLVIFDRNMIRYDALCARLLEISQVTGADMRTAPETVRTWKIPCCYGSHFGLDMENVCRQTGLSREEIIRRHSSTVYRIYMLGFLPGFVYLGGMDPELAVPRLAVPRTEIPKGSVGIGGNQTGIYPLSSPGGWQLIGATPLDLYDPDREEPVFFRAGDRIQFYPINSCEYYDILRQVLRNEYTPELISGRNNTAPEDTLPPGQVPNHVPAQAREFLEVVQKGLLTTVQDPGRYGHQDTGIPVSGAMDPLSCSAANELVGNSPREAVLEMTLWGGSYRFLDAGRIALTGADMKPKLNGNPIPMAASIEVKAGDRLDLSAASAGCRTYLAAAGGMEVPEVLGSRSTCFRCGLGGYHGRPLQTGDRLCVGKAAEYHPADPVFPAYRPFAAGLGAKAITLRVIPGPQDDRFTEAGKNTFYSEEYTLTPESDRMGCRLEGPVIESINGTDILSDGTVFGSIQVPGSGKPIVLMADRQTTGGYAKIATVIREDLPLLAQAVPGTKIRFRAVNAP